MSPPTADAAASDGPLSHGLQGATAVVTGGASGIGLATTQLLEAAGARVFVADLNDSGAAGTFVRTDVTSPAAIDLLRETVLEAAGPPDVLINAAGWDEIRPFVDSDVAFIEKIVRINLIGAMQVTRSFLPSMLEAGRGKLVFVASDAGRVGSSGETVYAGAKGGIIAFSKSVAREVARASLHVNCVCPGPTDTPLFASLPEKLRGALERAIPFRRLAQPQEVAQAILFLSSRQSDFITGQVLSVSGGLTMAG